jgi:serine/threonine protein kinase/HEAT repeat protein
MPTTSSLAGLSDADRRTLQTWLTDFEQSWDKDRLIKRVRELPLPGHPLRLPALTELVRIDLTKHWQHGQEARLETYLKTFPELGTADTVAVALIQAEYEAAVRAGAATDLDAYARRFPRQVAQLVQALETADGSRERPGRRSQPSTLAGPRTNPADGDPPEQFGRYRIERRLGKGGMGAVYLAHDTQLDRQVAVKIPHFSPEDGSAVLERFYREAKAAATINHPNICPVYDVGEVQGTHYLTMAYVAGRPLSAFIKAGKPIPLPQAVGVVRKLALALAEAHKRGVIHRDLKPSNVMVNERSEPVLMDFGLARRANEDTRLTRDGAILGTPAYMPPEQVNGDVEAMGPACDIYSLGVILYELLTLELPLEGPVMAMLARILTEQPEPPSKRRPDIDPQLDAICLKAMAKKIPDRYGSMAEFAAALTDYLRGSKGSTRPAGASQPVVTLEPVPAPTTTPNSSPPTLVPASAQVVRQEASPPPAPMPAERPSVTQPVPPPPPQEPVVKLPAPSPRWSVRQRRVFALVGGLVLVLAVGGVALFYFSGSGASPGGGANATKGPGDSRVVPLVKSLREDDDKGFAVSAKKLVALGDAAAAGLRDLLQDPNARTRERAATVLGDLGPAAAAAVPDLAALLGDREDRVRASAAQALAKFGVAAKPAQPLLLQALADPDASVRQAAAAALDRLGPPAKEDVPALRKALADDKPAVRRYAMQALARIGLDAKEAIAVYGPAAQDADREVRQHALQALSRVGPDGRDQAVSSLLAALRSPKADVRRDALAALEGIRWFGPSQVPALQTALADPSAEVRRFAAATLGNLGREAEPAVPALLDALRDPDAGVAQAAADALVKTEPSAELALPTLTRLVESPDKGVRQRALVVLTKLGPDARDKVRPLLLKALRDDDPGVRRPALQWLAANGRPTRADLPQLKAALRSTDPTIRGYTAAALAQLGPGARAEVLPLLLETLRDLVPEVRQKVLEGLDKLGPPEATDLPRLLQAARSDRPPVRLYAAKALGQLGPAAREAVPLLTSFLDDPDAEVAAAAAVALGTLGPEAATAVPQLLTSLNSRNKELVRQAATALSRISQGDKVVTALADVLRRSDRSDKDVQVTLAAALGKMGSAAKPAVPALVKALTWGPEVQDAAVAAFGRIGKDAVPALIEALKQIGPQNRSLRIGAARALGQIGPDARGPAVIELSKVRTREAKDKEVRAVVDAALGSIQRAGKP